jgi:hypothetical protein
MADLRALLGDSVYTLPFHLRSLVPQELHSGCSSRRVCDRIVWSNGSKSGELFACIRTDDWTAFLKSEESHGDCKLVSKHKKARDAKGKRVLEERFLCNFSKSRSRSRQAAQKEGGM